MALFLLGLALAVLLPAFVAVRDGERLPAAARELAAELHALRWQSVARGRGHGLWFRFEDGRWVTWEVEDRNGNGLSVEELQRGVDRARPAALSLGRMTTGVRIAFPARGPYPRIPPLGGQYRETDRPVRFGPSNLVAFSPLGTATSGSVHLTDGEDRWSVVVLYGPSARIRIWRFDRRSGLWRR